MKSGIGWGRLLIAAIAVAALFVVAPRAQAGPEVRSPGIEVVGGNLAARKGGEMSWSIFATGRKDAVREAVEKHQAPHLESQPEEKADYDKAKELILTAVDNAPTPCVKVDACGSRSVYGGHGASNVKVEVQSIHLLGVD